MAEPFIASKALNLMYTILTEKFSRKPFIDPGSRNDHGCRYEADIIVSKYPEYPDIPPSTWTVTLNVMDSDGEIWAEVKPKDGPESLKNPSVVLVDWWVRGGRMEVGDDDKKNPFRGDCDWYIGPDGYKRGRSESLRELVARGYDGREYRYELIRNPHVNVLISLTFVVEKTITCRVLGTLYDSSTLADCKLVCGTREFPVHGAILAAQSSVFAASFHRATKDTPLPPYTISGLRPDVLDALLQFVYMKELTKADGKLEELWTAADQLDMPELKRECERLMLGSVTYDSAFGCLCFAEKRGLKKLKVEAAKIISRESA